MTVSNELLDSLLADYKKPEDLIGEDGLLKQLTKKLVERALEAEMAEHLGHARNEPVANPAGNTRNGKSKKTLKGEFGELPIDIPRDRHGSFEPQLIPKHQTRWTGFDDKILSLYARGMTVREIQGHLEEMYGTEVSPSLISSITDAVIDDAKAWQSRALDALYPIVYLDCIHVKARDSGAVRVKAVYLALGINLAGEKELLGIWIAQTEGAKFWLQVVTELKNRGVADIFIACVDGLKGFPEAIEAVFPKTAVQLCLFLACVASSGLAYLSWPLAFPLALPFSLPLALPSGAASGVAFAFAGSAAMAGDAGVAGVAGIVAGTAGVAAFAGTAGVAGVAGLASAKAKELVITNAEATASEIKFLMALPLLDCGFWSQKSTVTGN